MTVVIYLAAIVAANLAVATFGPSITILDAFLFIGLDLTLRDRLHDEWRGRWLIAKMSALIVAAGVLSYIVNAGAGQIAFASTVAFMASAGADGIVYAILGERSWMVRANGSNVVGSAVDSLVFPTVAFGSFLPIIVLGQFAAKVLGGFVWSVFLNAVSLRRRPA